MINKTNYEIATEMLKPFLTSYMQSLLNEMESNKIIQKIDSTDDSIQQYELIQEVKIETILPELHTDNGPVLNDFKEFRKTIRGAYFHLGFSRSENPSSISFPRILEELDENGILNIVDYNKSPLKEIFSLDDRNMDDTDFTSSILQTFKDKKLDFAAYTNSVIAYFIRKKVFNYLNHFNISESKIPFLEDGVEIDFIGKSDDASFPDLLFEIKLRSRVSENIKELIFKAYETLKTYGRLFDKENRIIIIAVTNENFGNFEKLNYRFKKTLVDLFPDFIDRITFIPVDKYNLHFLERDLNRINFYDTLLFDETPKVVTAAKDFFANANLLKSETGTFSVWVKLKSIQDYLDKDMNFEYIVSHAANDYRSIGGDYQDVFSVSLASNKSGKVTSKSDTFYWRVWISNEQRENFYLKGPSLNSNSADTWHNLIVRWDHSKPLIEFIVNGSLCDENSNDYLKFWPTSFLEKMTVGTWGNKAQVHYIKLPLFRLITSTKYLDNDWIKNERNNYPSGS